VVEQTWKAGKTKAIEKEARAPDASAKGEKAMSVYKRGDVWWYKFTINGQLIRESVKSNSKTVAKGAEPSVPTSLRPF
jgi:hypothetical protein